MVLLVYAESIHIYTAVRIDLEMLTKFSNANRKWLIKRLPSLYILYLEYIIFTQVFTQIFLLISNGK